MTLFKRKAKAVPDAEAFRAFVMRATLSDGSRFNLRGQVDAGGDPTEHLLLVDALAAGLRGAGFPVEVVIVREVAEAREVPSG